MAVAILATDGWIQHLPFVGGPRPTEFGPVDGIWYGLVAGDGDASAGNVSLNGRLSFDRKEDWIYIFGGMTTTKNAVAGEAVFTQINTGPLIPTGAVATTVNNPSFSIGGNADPVTGHALTTGDITSGGNDRRRGMPIFGDKRIPGIFLMLAAGWETNTDGATYQMSSWGFLIKYNSFFRDVPPRLA